MMQSLRFWRARARMSRIARLQISSSARASRASQRCLSAASLSRSERTARPAIIVLDALTEMRTAALLQKVMHGAEALPAQTALRLATINGARAMGLEQEIGSLEAGKRADVVIVRLDQLHSAPRPADIVSALVYSAQSGDVSTTIIDGRVVMRDRKLLTLDEPEVIEEANREAALLMTRAGI